MNIAKSGRVRRCVGVLAIFVCVVGGCGPDNPKIASAPAYEPPQFTPPPPTIKGADGQSYTYGSNPDYQEAMEKMNASQGVGR